MTNIETMADALDRAASGCQAIAQLSGGIDVATAYAIQNRSIARRIERCERPIGVKMGFTSRAKMAQMGVSDMIVGQLTDAMLVEDGAMLDLGRFIHPRVEPELAFLLCKPVSGTVTAIEAQAAIEAVAPAMEIIDSRYLDFRFNLADVIADNASSSGLVIGAWASMQRDLSNLGMVMSFDGRPVQIGSSAAILGNPVRALIAAARLSSAAGIELRAGDIVMAGAATAAETLAPNTAVRLDVQHIGRAEFVTNGKGDNA